MGLDQYLEVIKRPAPEVPDWMLTQQYSGHYFSNWEHSDDAERRGYQYMLHHAGLTAFETPNTGAYLEEVERQVSEDEWVTEPATGLIVPVAYWRKANAIHAWFVREVQGGVDDCGHYPVDGEALAYLHCLCTDTLAAYDARNIKRVLKLLPPQGGFFFGSTDVDEYYAEDLRSTITQVERVIRIAATIRGGVELQYHASW